MKIILKLLRGLLRPFPYDARRLLEANPWLLNTPAGEVLWQEGK